MRLACRLRRIHGWLAFAGLLAVVAVAAADGDKPAKDDWKYDRIVLKNGSTLSGLILDESAKGIHFQNVRRQSGRPTFVLSTTLSPVEIERVERLSDAERAVLKARLQEIDSTGQVERQRLDQLELVTVAWEGQPAAGRRYRSEFFTLESDEPPEIVRRAADRLEQIYAAYGRYLPPRGRSRGPTTIVLLRSQATYAARLKSAGLQFVNVAYCNPAANEIVCASELERLGEDLDRARKENQQLRADLDRREAVLVKLYKNPKDFARHIQPIRDTRQRIDQQDRANERVFGQATQQIFSILYHEAFHAYLANCVYPPPHPEPPRWLNEGLAQIFETAIVEGGELRLGHADLDRLTRAKDAARKNELVPIEQLLHAEAKQFQAAHAGDRSVTGQYYLTAWAAAFHLTFERRLLGTAALDSYVRHCGRRTNLRGPFESLVGSTVEEYQQELRRYLEALQPDGSTSSGLRGK